MLAQGVHVQAAPPKTDSMHLGTWKCISLTMDSLIRLSFRQSIISSPQVLTSQCCMLKPDAAVVAGHTIQASTPTIARACSTFDVAC
jgi:hypothetical protein